MSKFLHAALFANPRKVEVSEFQVENKVSKRQDSSRISKQRKNFYRDCYRIWNLSIDPAITDVWPSRNSSFLPWETKNCHAALPIDMSLTFTLNNSEIRSPAYPTNNTQTKIKCPQEKRKLCYKNERSLRQSPAWKAFFGWTGLDNIFLAPSAAARTVGCCVGDSNPATL